MAEGMNLCLDQDECVFKSSTLWPFSLQKLCSKKPKLIKTIKVGSHDNIVLIGNEIWIPCQLWLPKNPHPKPQIYFVSKDGERIQHEMLPEQMGVLKCITQEPNVRDDAQSPNAVVSSDKGLYVVTRKAEILDTIKEEEYSEVHSSGNEIYALRYGLQCIEIFRYESASWQQRKTVRLPFYNDGFECDYGHTFLAFSQQLKIYSMEHDNMRTYSTTQNKHIEVKDQHHPETPTDKLYYGSLCAYDVTGAMLFCEQQRMQILDTDNTWKVTKLKDLGHKIQYAVAVDEHSLWASSYRQLLLYTFKDGS